MLNGAIFRSFLLLFGLFSVGPSENFSADAFLHMTLQLGTNGTIYLQCNSTNNIRTVKLSILITTTLKWKEQYCKFWSMKV